MTPPARLLALLLVDGHAACFARDEHVGWQHDPLYREDWYPLTGADALNRVLNEIDDRINHSDQLAGFTLNLIYDQAALPWLADVGRALAALHCCRWQVLQWAPLRQRAALLGGQAPATPLPAIDWLQQSLLPVLEATFHYRNDALAAERERAEQQHAETLESLRADRLRLEAEIATQREQLAALQRPAIDDLLSYLPAIYSNLSGTRRRP